LWKLLSDVSGEELNSLGFAGSAPRYSQQPKVEDSEFRDSVIPFFKEE
jgi:hypothetical protein